MNQRTQRHSTHTRPRWLVPDADRFRAGDEFRLYRHLGAHADRDFGETGTRFAVWAPHARAVSVVGDFNGWSSDAHPMCPDGPTGIWSVFVPAVAQGTRYKYRIAPSDGPAFDRGDPFARESEAAPGRASLVRHSDYAWQSGSWAAARRTRMSLSEPWSVYEVHLGSWRRDPDHPASLLGYRELAATLPAYLAQLGFTHVSLLPLVEHEEYASWGYRSTGFFASAGAYGSPDELRALVDALHGHGIGVLMDWTPAAFAAQPDGLGWFDGTRLYERDASGTNAALPAGLSAFDHRRGEVRSFIGSSAMFWLDEFRLDGLRFVGLPSMLGARAEGESAGATLLRTLNGAIHDECPDVRTIADDAASAADLTRPLSEGGFGFDLAWDASGVIDTLACIEHGPADGDRYQGVLAGAARRCHAGHSIRALTHDAVAPGRGSLMSRLPGDDWQRFARLRLLYGCLWTMPGRPLLFMGGEFAQRLGWQPDISLDWHLLGEPPHAGVHRWVGDLNRLLQERRALRGTDDDAGGLAWLAPEGAHAGLLAYERRCPGEPPLVVVCNFEPVARHNLRIGLDHGGHWQEVVNSDAGIYGGGGTGNFGGVDSVPVASRGHYQSLVVTAPPLAIVVLERAGSA